jgi:hypothetical protein
MPGLVPGIHVVFPSPRSQDVDGRDKPAMTIGNVIETVT